MSKRKKSHSLTDNKMSKRKKSHSLTDNTMFKRTKVIVWQTIQCLNEKSHSLTDNTMSKRKKGPKDKQWTTKHYAEN